MTIRKNARNKTGKRTGRVAETTRSTTIKYSILKFLRTGLSRVPLERTGFPSGLDQINWDFGFSKDMKSRKKSKS